MPRFLVIILLLGSLYNLSTVFAQLPSFQPNRPLEAEQLNALVKQINGLTGTGTGQVINANCATLGQALQQASPGDTIQLAPAPVW